jgi:hypothetical protein
MKNFLIVLISLGGIIFVCVPSLAQNPQTQKGVLYSTNRTAQNLEGVVPCDARSHPMLYYIPVDEMKCEVPGGYGIDFEGTLELEAQDSEVQELDRLTLFAIH